MDIKKAVVLLSGGLDSTVCLAIASSEYECTALSFDYGQKHAVELECAKWQANNYNADHIVVPITLPSKRKSALTNNRIKVPIDRDVETMEESIPVTYVPARNTLFLSYALQLAEEIDADKIFAGVNAVDYSGYPDCRPEYISAYQKVINLATKKTVEHGSIEIMTPLINMTKINIVKEAISYDVDLNKTCSCYRAKIFKESDPTEWKIIECGKCDSCILRNTAIKEILQASLAS